MGYLEPLVINFSNVIKQVCKKLIQTQLPTVVPYQCSPKYNSNSIYIPLGISVTGTIYLNLKSNSNTYLTGTTGSGKSTCLKSMLCSLIQLYKPYQLKFYMVDLKKSELFLFKNIKHTISYTDTIEGLYITLNEVLNECNNRYEMFSRFGVADIYEYNAQAYKKLDERILVIEELVMLLLDNKKQCLTLLKQILAISRACGIHTIMSMQRPSADILNPLLKSLTLNKISFKQEDEANSNIAIDNPNAKYINMPGRGFLKCGSVLTEFQAYNISTIQIKEIIKPYLKDNKIDSKPPQDIKSINNTLNKIEPLRKANNTPNKEIKLNKL